MKLTPQQLEQALSSEDEPDLEAEYQAACAADFVELPWLPTPLVPVVPLVPALEPEPEAEPEPARLRDHHLHHAWDAWDA